MRSAGGTRSTWASQSPTRARTCCEHAAILVVERGERLRRLRIGDRGGKPRAEQRKRRRSEMRTKRERRNAAARRFDPRIREIAHQRRDVLDLVGVEKPEALVDVGRNAAHLELVLEFAMARARSEEDRDVPGPRLPGNARLPVADRLLAQDAGDFRRHGRRAATSRRSSAETGPDDAQHWDRGSALPAETGIHSRKSIRTPCR